MLPERAIRLTEAAAADESPLAFWELRMIALREYVAHLKREHARRTGRVLDCAPTISSGSRALPSLPRA